MVQLSIRCTCDIKDYTRKLSEENTQKDMYRHNKDYTATQEYNHIDGFALHILYRKYKLLRRMQKPMHYIVKIVQIYQNFVTLMYQMIYQICVDCIVKRGIETIKWLNCYYQMHTAIRESNNIIVNLLLKVNANTNSTMIKEYGEQGILYPIIVVFKTQFTKG